MVCRMTRYRAILALAPAIFLAGCGSSDSQAGPGGVTANEAQALDEAAEMIEERRLKPDEAENGQAEGSETEE